MLRISFQLSLAILVLTLVSLFPGCSSAPDTGALIDSWTRPGIESNEPAPDYIINLDDGTKYSLLGIHIEQEGVKLMSIQVGSGIGGFPDAVEWEPSKDGILFDWSFSETKTATVNVKLDSEDKAILSIGSQQFELIRDKPSLE